MTAASRGARTLAPILVGILILAIWEGACRFWHVPDYLFPAPSAIAVALVTNWPVLVRALGTTLLITIEAFVVAVVLGTSIAFVFVQNKLIEASLFPYAVLLQVTPVVAVAPLIIILVKNTALSLMICAAVVAIFPVISNTTIGLHSVDPGLLSYFRMNKATRFETLVRLRIPSALPFFLAGLRIASGLALIGAVVAEFVAGTGGRSAGLAYQILQAGFQLDIPLMFAALLLIALSGVALYLLMVGLNTLLLGGWHESTLGEAVALPVEGLLRWGREVVGGRAEETPGTLSVWRIQMKLVLLEALIVLIAVRAVLSLMGHSPPWPTPLWEFCAGLALISTASLAVEAARKNMPHHGPVTPPHIPLDRIAPFRLEAMTVRSGARGHHDIHLN